MTENENVVEMQQPAPPQNKPSFGKRFAAGLKERGRKMIVKLKRRPTTIPFLVLVVSTILMMCALGSLSQLAMSPEYSGEMQGLCLFICVLFSILVIMLFMYAFPKRSKKPNMPMLIMAYVFMGVLIALDLYLYIMWSVNYADDLIRVPEGSSQYESYWITGTGSTAGVYSYLGAAMGSILAHCILVIIVVALTAACPLYHKLLMKINTRIDIESTQLKEEIDTSEED